MASDKAVQDKLVRAIKTVNGALERCDIPDFNTYLQRKHANRCEVYFRIVMTVYDDLEDSAETEGSA